MLHLPALQLASSTLGLAVQQLPQNPQWSTLSGKLTCNAVNMALQTTCDGHHQSGSTKLSAAIHTCRSACAHATSLGQHTQYGVNISEPPASYLQC
jgi:hypothetical protein